MVWSVINIDLSKYTIDNMKERLEEKLILSNELVSEGEYEKRSNIISIVEKEWILKEWFCSVDIGEWEDVEIIIHGSNEAPVEELLSLADRLFKQIGIHLEKALVYLKKFIPSQEIDNYDLSTITIGRIVNFDDSILLGFSIHFVYGDYPYAFQYKVKFKEDGWPIGFEAGPL